jgi:hypothetical protein
MKITGLVFFIIIFIVLICLCNMPIFAEKQDAFQVIHGGTKYINCRINPSYPFKTGKNLITISGITDEISGTKSFPWRVLTIKGYPLFNAETRKPILSFIMQRKNITVTGYINSGSITFKGRWGGTKVFDNALFVCEIVDWVEIIGDATLEDTGIVSTPDVRFWYPKEKIPHHTFH